MAFAPVSWPEEKFVVGFIQINPDGGCELNGKAIQCDRVPLQLRAMHLSPGFSIQFEVDEAPYESVVMMLDSLKSNGFNDVRPMAILLGTNPSESVSHWIKLLSVGGVRNQPSPMVLIATERFRTWGDYLIVLPASDFAKVDRLATARTGHGDCLPNGREYPNDPYVMEQKLLLIERAGGVPQSCVLPRAATSCEFLSEVIALNDVGWGAGDREVIRALAKGSFCDAGN